MARVKQDRFDQLPEGLVALTATARGMVDHTMTQAAKQAFGELMPVLGEGGLRDKVRSWLSIMPDKPKGPDDPDCRYVAAVVFGYAMSDGTGRGEQPPVTLGGTLQWQPVAAGRYAVFLHVGPYDTLFRSWDGIYRDWLPSSGQTLRDAPPMELMLNTPDRTPPAELRTELWVPVSS